MSKPKSPSDKIDRTDRTFTERLEEKRIAADARLYQAILRRIDHLLDENGNFRVEVKK